jgi:hypothetical protein
LKIFEKVLCSILCSVCSIFCSTLKNGKCSIFVRCSFGPFVACSMFVRSFKKNGTPALLQYKFVKDRCDLISDIEICVDDDGWLRSRIQYVHIKYICLYVKIMKIQGWCLLENNKGSKGQAKMRAMVNKPIAKLVVIIIILSTNDKASYLNSDLDFHI